ncbi:MAG: hypothetical protein II942_03250 [Alphaproteobacteria bacterium]|nr:hypothetical protein [Alphaproteobacteria bacterium]
MFLKNYHEQGRTMVEMIGVLAMIGALTLGGLSLYGRSLAKLHANNIVEEARKRTALANENRFTKGMFDRRDANANYVTAYGYGLSADSNELYKSSYMGQSVIEVAVGAIHGGNRITRGVCRELVKMINTDETGQAVDINIGDVVRICEGTSSGRMCNCRGNIQPFSCDPEEGEEEQEMPEVICIAIRG